MAKKPTIILITFLSLLDFAQANTAVFTDSQFTASPYGQNLARNCLNPSTLTDSANVDFISAPAGRAEGLISSKKNPQPIYTFKATSDQVTGHRSTGTYYHKPYFDEKLNDPSVKRIMVFMGVNDINFSNGRYSLSNWSEIAQTIRAKGKECVVGLPPMITNTARARVIRAYNIKVAEVLKDTSCKIVDTSNSLTQGPYKTFATGDGLHFTTRSSKEVAEATCEAVKALKNETENQETNQEETSVTQNPQNEMEEEVMVEASLDSFFSSEY